MTHQLPRVFDVYYRKDVAAGFRDSLRSVAGCATRPFVEGAYVLVGTVSARDVDELFALLNDGTSRPNPLGTAEKQEFIRAEFLHTSMSVGDVAIDKETGDALECGTVGWEKLSREVAK